MPLPIRHAVRAPCSRCARRSPPPSSSDLALFLEGVLDVLVLAGALGAWFHATRGHLTNLLERAIAPASCPRRRRRNRYARAVTIAEKAAAFRRLHEGPGAFVMPNPWDIGTARILAGLGYEALATTSAGLAYSLGRRDGEGAVTRAEALEHAAVIVAATPLPVNGDLENGFGHDPESVAETIRGAAAAGSRRLLDRGFDLGARRSDLPALAGRRAHRGGRGGRGCAALRVHPHGARRELPARAPRSRRHDRAPAGLRGGRSGCAVRAAGA